MKMSEDQILRALLLLTIAVQELTKANKEMLAALTTLMTSQPKED